MAKYKTLGVMALMLALGALAGLIIASNFNWTRAGLAENTPGVTPVAPAQAATELSGEADLAATSKAYVAVAKRVMPTVVSITSEKVMRVRNPFTEFFHEEWWGRRRGRGEREFRQEGLGSGVIISPDGYVLTNNHVIRESDAIAVLIEKKSYTAKIIGTDPKTDLAVIKIDATNLPVARLGDSDALEVGELVLAVGSPFSLQLAHSVTAGIVSGKGRTQVGVGDIDYEDFIQTDAAINPGNSGGALVNLRGEVVGINTAIVSGGWGGGNVGIGFAIPINLARQIMTQLIETGKVVRGWLGVNIQSVDEEVAREMKLPTTDGALVTRVMPGSPAEKAGMQEEDFVVTINETPIRDQNHLMNVVASYRPGTTVRVKLIRDGRERVLTVKLGKRPEDPEQAVTSAAPRAEALGLVVADLTEKLAGEFDLTESSGVVVIEVEPGSAADEEGIRPGDIIKEVDRKPVRTVAEYRQVLAAGRERKVVLLRIARRDANFFVALKKGND
ncbi:MAG: Do family serine endopeptidase [candidate division KSB1 bacterium]|nr:Do family serine endopeptidase [candidate division KSB1 bacterium]MDZ7274500.1 Do family serine endopeptidase [candidate division KSB1 bacterium]MDZ7284839.1 Do family serine endopeptidase [candidate division KSB1 bacterium]MDZ7297741.1 Do family serine endopeptidase [candidate division KSB1 bacterium]MDZ7307584.1 Do family serine endopeptidase [candidate division KSB1 bacterium]